jgi:hypothetical protein
MAQVMRSGTCDENRRAGRGSVPDIAAGRVAQTQMAEGLLPPPSIPQYLICSDAEDVGEDLSRMLARIYLVVNARNFPLLVDQKAHAIRIPRLSVARRAVRDSHRFVGIAQQRKGEAVLRGEGRVGIDRIKTRAKNLDVVGIVIRLMVAEPAALGRSSRGVGHRIKPQKHFAPAQRIERAQLALVRRERKAGRVLSNFYHRDSSLRAPRAARSFNSMKTVAQPTL